jgi:hypothetical protein
MIEFTDWASRILRRSFEASRRFHPSAQIRMARGGDGVEFAIVDEPAPGDRVVEGDGFTVLVAEGLDGVVDVVEPHDRLILRAAGSTERSVPHDPRPASPPRPPSSAPEGGGLG